MRTKTLGAFRNLVGKDEKTVSFHIVDENGYDSGQVYEFICPKEMDKRGDVLAGIEETLHTLLDEGFDDESIEFYLGAVKREKVDPNIETYAYIDLDYILPGVPCKYDFRRDLLRKELYERFKLFWMSSHGYTLSDAVKAVVEYAEETYGDYSMRSCDDLVSEWEIEWGFNNEIYPCYSEFITSEYLDPSSIINLCWSEEEKLTYIQDPYFRYADSESEDE